MKVRKVFVAVLTMLLLIAVLTLNSSLGTPDEERVSVEPKVEVKVWVDKGCGAIYHFNEFLTVYVKLESEERGGYLTIFDLLSNGTVQIIYPNKYHQDNYIKSGIVYSIPASGDPFYFYVTPPKGKETLLAVVTKDDIPLVEEDYSQFTENFPSLKGTHGDILRQIKERLERVGVGWWAADSCFFCVGGPCTANWALIIGIEDYINDPMWIDGELGWFPDLNYTVDDAIDMKEILSNTFNVKILTNSEATYDNIKRSFADWLGNAAEDDIALFYFSGHGTWIKDLSGDEEDGKDEVLVPHDAAKINKFIVDDEIRDWISQLRARRVVFIADSCHAGTVHKDIRTFNFIDKTKSPVTLTDSIGSDLSSILTKGLLGIGIKGKLIAMEASKPNETSGESPGLKNGIFTYFLLEGLRGKADADGNGRISAQEACEYAKKKVPEHRPSQHPMCTDYIGEEVYLTSTK